VSSTKQEFLRFFVEADEDSDKDPNLAIVLGARAGQVAVIVAQRKAQYWSTVK
jgi:hypothetical protein